MLRRWLWALAALALVGYGLLGIGLGRIVPLELIVARLLKAMRFSAVLRGDAAVAASVRCCCLGGMLYLWKVHEGVVAPYAQMLRLVGIATLGIAALVTYLFWYSTT